MIEYGTKVVGGVTPGKGGKKHLDRPVFNTVKDAVEAVPTPASSSSRRLLCRRNHGGGGCRPSSGLLHHRRHPGPGHDDGQALPAAVSEGAAHDAGGAQLRGPHQPGKAMLGIMPGHIYSRGKVGVVTRSGTLGYEAAAQMNELGIGRPPASASAATRSTAVRSSTSWRCSRRIRRPMRS